MFGSDLYEIPLQCPAKDCLHTMLPRLAFWVIGLMAARNCGICKYVKHVIQHGIVYSLQTMKLSSFCVCL